MDKKSADAVLDRLRLLFAVSSDSALAEAMGVNRQTLGGWRNRKTIPYAECIKIASDMDVSLDWLLAGKGEFPRTDASSPSQSTNISRKEEMMLSLFRELSEAEQGEIQAAAESKKRLRDLEKKLEEITLERQQKRVA